MVVPYRSDTSEDEMDDQDIQKLLIVTQTPPACKKHSGSDRTATFISKNKLTSDIAQAINDGLYFYEQVRCQQMITAVLHSHMVLRTVQDLKLELDGSDSSYATRKVSRTPGTCTVYKDFLHGNFHDDVQSLNQVTELHRIADPPSNPTSMHCVNCIG